MNELKKAKDHYLDLKKKVDELSGTAGKQKERSDTLQAAIVEYENSIEAAKTVHQGLVKDYAVGTISEADLQKSADSIERLKSQKTMNAEAWEISQNISKEQEKNLYNLRQSCFNAEKQLWFRIREEELAKLPIDILKRARIANSHTDASPIEDAVCIMCSVNDDAVKVGITQTLKKEYGLL